jgi:hypothetical protein
MTIETFAPKTQGKPPVDIQITGHTTIKGTDVFKGQRIRVAFDDFCDLAAGGKCRKLKDDEKPGQHQFDAATLKVIPGDLREEYEERREKK